VKGDTPESLMQRADTALYEAKRGGKAQVSIARPPAVVV
jgi:PleD family two-component response regulator